MKAKRRTPPIAAHRGTRTPSTPATERAKSRRHLGDDERIAVRRVKALRLRLQGLSYRAIASALKVDVAVAWSDVQAEVGALRTLTGGLAEDYREVELRRCDDWTSWMTPRARKGDPKSMMALVKIQERRAKLLGLDAAEKLEHTGKDGGPLVVKFGGRYKPGTPDAS